MPLGLAEKIFCVVALLLLSGALLPVLRPSEDVYQGDPAAQVMWSSLYLVALLLVLMRFKSFVHVATKDKFLLLLVAIVSISVLWSVAPEVTLRRSVALAGTTVFGFYLATRYSLGEQLRLLAWAMGIAALLSLLFILILPSYGISSDSATAGDWKGVYGHKNSFGKTMTLSAIVFFILAASSRRYRWLAWACCGLSFGLVLSSNSVTAWVILLAFLVLWFPYKALRWHHTAVVPFLIITVLLGAGVAILLWSNVEAVLGGLGRNVTLSGRTEIWSAVLDMISKRPWLGYGYDAFWLGWEGYSSQVWLATGQTYSHAHNGILGLWLELGLLGVLVFAIVLLRSLFRAVTWVRSTTRAEGIWPLAFLTFFLLNNLVESAVLSSNSLIWVLYVANAISPIYRQNQRDSVGRLRTPQITVAQAQAAK